MSLIFGKYYNSRLRYLRTVSRSWDTWAYKNTYLPIVTNKQSYLCLKTFILSSTGKNNFTKMDRFILESLKIIKRKERECTFLGLMTFTMATGVRIWWAAMEPTYLRMEKLMKGKSTKAPKKAMESVHIRMEESIKALGTKIAKLAWVKSNFPMMLPSLECSSPTATSPKAYSLARWALITFLYGRTKASCKAITGNRTLSSTTDLLSKLFSRKGKNLKSAKANFTVRDDRMMEVTTKVSWSMVRSMVSGSGKVKKSVTKENGSKTNDKGLVFCI